MANGVAEHERSHRSRSRAAWVVAALRRDRRVDQLTKAWAVAASGRRPKHVVGDFVVFDLARNAERLQPVPGLHAGARRPRDRDHGRSSRARVRQATDRWIAGRARARARRRARQPRRPPRPVAGIPARPRRRLRRGRLVAGVQRRRLVHHDRRDRAHRPDAVRARAATTLHASMIDGPLAVPAALAGDRVDRALSFLTGWPRAAVQELIDDGAVTVDGNVVAKSHRLHEGSVLEVLAEPDARRAARRARPACRGRRALCGRRRRRGRQAGRARRASRAPGTPRHARQRPARAFPGYRAGRRSVRPGHRPPARPRHERPARRRPLGRARTTRSSPAPARTVERLYAALVWGRLGVAARHDRRADRPFRRAAHADGGAQRGQGGAHGVPRRAHVRTPRAACSSASSRRAARTRSACISRRSATRSSATDLRRLARPDRARPPVPARGDARLRSPGDGRARCVSRIRCRPTCVGARRPRRRERPSGSRSARCSRSASGWPTRVRSTSSAR